MTSFNAMCLAESKSKARSPVRMLFGSETLGKEIMPWCRDKGSEEMNITCNGFWHSVYLPKKAAFMNRLVTKILL